MIANNARQWISKRRFYITDLKNKGYNPFVVVLYLRALTDNAPICVECSKDAHAPKAYLYNSSKFVRQYCVGDHK